MGAYHVQANLPRLLQNFTIRFQALAVRNKMNIIYPTPVYMSILAATHLSISGPMRKRTKTSGIGELCRIPLCEALYS